MGWLLINECLKFISLSWEKKNNFSKKNVHFKSQKLSQMILIGLEEGLYFFISFKRSRTNTSRRLADMVIANCTCRQILQS